MSWFSNLSAICVCFSTRCRGKSFQQERESTVVFFISYYSVQPDESSFAFSLNHTTCDLRERNLTRSVTTGIVDFSLHRLCRPYSKYSSIFFKKVQCMAKCCQDKLHPKKVSYGDYQIEDYFCERTAVKKLIFHAARPGI